MNYAQPAIKRLSRHEIAALTQPARATTPAQKLGRHKARVFVSALGIDRDSWEYLREQIGARVVDAELSEVRTGRYGLRYSVPMLIEGLNGQTHEVATGWIIEEEGGPPRLTTAYVNVP